MICCYQFFNCQNTISVHTNYYTKQGKIIVRLLPNSKSTFEFLRTSTIKVTRFEKVEQNLINEKLIERYLKPFDLADTLNWMGFYRKDPNRMAFIYQYLHPNDEQKKLATTNKNQKNAQQLFDLVLLNCDFSSDAARSSGLMFSDSTIDNKSTYVYKLAYYNKDETKLTEVASITIDSKVLSTNPEITNFEAKGKKGKAYFKWKVFEYKKSYSGYYIERSIDKLNYVKVNDVPMICFIEQDENKKDIITFDEVMKEQDKTYYYRIRGVNFFGEESEPSNVVEIKNYKQVNSFPLIDSIEVINNKMVFLKWRMNEKSETDLITKYILGRSKTDNGAYEFIYQSSSQLEYLDKTPLENNFYKVFGITQSGDTLSSFSRMASISDTIAPAVPKQLSAVVDKKGRVTVSWQRNNEKDLQGYKLFKVNALHEEFVMVNQEFITDTFYKEVLPLNNLSHYLYYAVVATDNMYNSSAKSEPFKLKRPDTIAPAKPIITHFILKQRGVLIYFNLSQSDDIAYHEVLRHDAASSKNVVIRKLESKDSIKGIIDTTAILGEKYMYQLIAVDGDDNFSLSNSIAVDYETGFRNPITEIKAQEDRTKHLITLQWKKYSNETESYVIYRASKTQPYTIINTLEGTETSFVDKNLNIGNVYYYKIKANLKNGAETIISKPIEVEY